MRSIQRETRAEWRAWLAAPPSPSSSCRPSSGRYRPAQAAHLVDARYQVLTLVANHEQVNLADRSGTIAPIRSWPWLRRRVEALDRYHAAFPAALWLLLFGLSLGSALLRLPRPKLWRAE